MLNTFAQALAARGIDPADIAAVELRAKTQACGLETAVLEQGLLSEAQVIELVVELSKLPRPPLDLVAQLSPAAAPLFPQPLAERHGMVPLGLQRRQLQLMVRHPVDLAQVDEIGFLLSRPIKLYVGTELEVAEAMNEVYGLPIPERFQALRKQVGPAPVAAAPVAAPIVPIKPVAPPLPEPSAPTRPPIGILPVGTPVASRSLTPIDLPVAGAVDSRSLTPIDLPVAPVDSRSLTPVDLPVAGAVDSRSVTPLEVPVAPPTSTPTLTEALVAPSAAEGPPAAAIVPTPPPAAQAPAATVTIGAGPDPTANAFWDEAGDILSLKPRAPILPETSAPLPIAEPPAEVSPFETAPFEATPVEAQPLTSGFAGRLGPERRISAAEAMASLREQGTRDGVIGTAISYLRGAFDFVAIFTRHGDSFQVFEASGVDYGGGADLAQTVVDLDRSRVLRTVVEGRAPYVGQVPAGDPLESALGAVGRARLRAVLLYPVVIRDRTVAVVHGDRGGEALAPRQLSDVALVLSQLGAQLERVLRERRRGAAAREPVPQPAPPKAIAAPVAVVPPPLPARVTVAEVSAPAPIPLRTEPSQPPLSGEDDLALRAAALADQEPFEVPIDWVDVDEDSSFPDQVRAFLSGDPPARAKAAQILRGGGADAAWALSERFPGPLFVFRMAIDELPGPDGIGPVLGLMAAIGSDAIPALLQIADVPGEERRFWATVLLAKLGDGRAIDVLARRLLDSSPDIALAARRGLYRLRKEPGFAPMLDQVTAELTTTSNPERLTAIIRALGQFHHIAAIPRLIALVGIRDPQISGAAADALRELTRQDFGSAERRWASWWSEAKERPRLHWLIEALESRDRDLRLAAISELTEFAGLDFGYRSDVEPRKQEIALGRWREWWEREVRNRASAPSDSA